ncbi:MAG: diguanylate cyclase [Pyrinomonadaceae bacterium]
MQFTPSSTARSREQGRVLLVCDDATFAAYREPLEGAGFVVVGVAGGVGAMVALRRTRPHAIVASNLLKGVSAEELARVLAQSQSAVPLVLIGAEAATIERRASALNAGAFDYFQLPAEISLFLARITQVVKMQQTVDWLRAEADRDYLTGLANRRRFRNALGQELERWRRYQVPCGLLMLDIDHLKKINDAHGHTAGDVAIRHVGSSLTGVSRDNDTSARLGGEEFALLLAGADEAKCLAAAERLREVVSATELERIGTITVSIGVASCPAHASSERSLFAASDAALYLAKSEGRNRAVAAPQVSSSIASVL